MNPCPLVEGDYNSRLDIIKDVPPGKVYYHFENVDMFHAKDVLRDIACIRGGVPISMMVTGSPEDIKERCKKLIDYVGKDGGFIMDAGVGLDDAKEENIRAMIDFTKEYGVYKK
jgi:uroporphyrinogen-III decarboxylase